MLQKVDEELDVATESFLEGENCTVNMERREVSHFVCWAMNYTVRPPPSVCAPHHSSFLGTFIVRCVHIWCSQCVANYIIM